MKFLLLSDVHASSKNPIARKDDVLEAFEKKMSFVFRYAEKNKATILQAGDWFHKPRDWRLLSIMIDLLDEYPKVDVYTIYGQHDMYMYSDTDISPTSMSILFQTGHWFKLKRRPVVVGDVSIYGCDFGGKVPVPKGETNILVIHAPIASKELFPDHDFTSPEYFSKEHKGWDLILCGDIHRQFVFNSKSTQVVNTGPIIRLDGSKYNMKHHPSFFVWDSEYRSLDKVQIPHDKGDKVLSRGHIERANEFGDALEAFTNAVKKSAIEDYISVKDTIVRLVKKYKANKLARKFLAEVMDDD